MKKIDLAYTAGIIDGEGCIGIYLHGEGKYNNYRLSVQMTSKDEWLPMWLKFAYGGFVCKRESKRANQSACWNWGIHAKQAGEFLRLILPYLRLRRQQAEIAIKFQSRRQPFGRNKKPQSVRILDEADSILLKSIHHYRAS